MTRSNGDPTAIAQASVALPRTDPLRWLKAQANQARMYWKGRREDCRIAGFGEADAAFARAPASLAHLTRQLRPMLSRCADSIRYYGGMRFEQETLRDTKWERFGAYWFMLPRFELRTSADSTTLYCNLIPARDCARKDKILAMIAALAPPAEGASGTLPTSVRRWNTPSEAEWHAMIEWTLEALEDHALNKVVLAREASFSFAEPLHPLVLLEQLAAGTPYCFHYLFQPRHGPAFVGASPERLFSRQHRAIESEAVAGTRPLGTSKTDDARLLDELLHSEKERREHEYVRISLREELEPLSESFQLDPEPSEMKLSHGRHLVSRIHAALRPGITSLDVLGALHPTPAVGGYPTKLALQAISDLETFDRGWYAGPVGWIGPDQADFAVAIRSGLVAGRQLSLYSGAGIVAGSTPWSEWEEIEHKIQGFTSVLGLPSSGVQAALMRHVHA